MQTIVYHVLAEYGHFGPTLHFTRQLAQQGIRVVYLSELDLQEHVERAGFEFAPYAKDIYPKGAMHARNQLDIAGRFDWWFGRDLAMWAEARSGRLEAQLATFKPDLIISDVVNPDTTLVAHKMGVPFIRATVFPPTRYQPGVPPMWSDALPGELSAWELETEWACYHTLLFVKPWIHRPNPIPREEFYGFVEACGVSPAQINFRNALNYIVDSDPELIMHPRELDFPSPPAPHQAYIGPCLDDLPPGTWTYDGRRSDAPLIYFSFGNNALQYPRTQAMLERVLDAARMRPDLDFVVSMPDQLMRSHTMPPTVHARPWLPQREVLREADLFITHAGASSTREAIWEGVPMLAVPCNTDQRGMAGRIVYHELGERMHRTIAPAKEVVATIDRLLVDSKYPRAVERMRAAFRSYGRELGSQFITAVMNGDIKPVPSSYYDDLMDRVYRDMMG